MRWRQFDLSLMFQGAFGFKIFNMRKYGMGLAGSGSDNVLRSAYLDDKDVSTGGASSPPTSSKTATISSLRM